jgi:putative FmdB family regulatory protein
MPSGMTVGGTLEEPEEEVAAMPIFEYECRACERQFQRLMLKREEEERLQCPTCGGRELRKLISRVVYHVSEQDRLDAYKPNARQDDAFYKDSRNIGLHAKKRAQQMGIDLGSAYEEKVDKLRTDPGSVLKDTE